jgi:predicted membrane channel-forming protein YqfA (hemolysin III family)
MVAMERPQSMGEEIANSLSHGLGFVAAVAAAPILIVTTAQTGRTLNVIGAAIFAVTMVLFIARRRSTTPFRTNARRRFCASSTTVRSTC